MSAAPQSAAPKLGIIAGGGAAPRYLIEACQKTGRPFHVVCLEGQADKDLAQDVPHLWLPLGAATKLKELADAEQIKEIVMIGRVRRPSLLEIKPDWLALKVLTKIGMNMLGDDALLRAIGTAMEEEAGVKVIAIQDVFKDLLTPEGQLGSVAIDEEAQKDITRGIDVAKALGRLDVGQSVIVQQGMVLGVEAIEGTDALIKRAAGLKREGTGSILVKIAKPQQDNRYDLPTIGPDTIAAMAEAGVRGVVLEAKRSLLIEREKTIAAADAAGIFIMGFAING
ncbi:MAG: UDP-2,3-diacylglucosamine diphosphatase LpxI [Alphaproteobacteria bacterium]